MVRSVWAHQHRGHTDAGNPVAADVAMVGKSIETGTRPSLVARSEMRRDEGVLARNCCRVRHLSGEPIKREIPSTGAAREPRGCRFSAVWRRGLRRPSRIASCRGGWSKEGKASTTRLPSETTTHIGIAILIVKGRVNDRTTMGVGVTCLGKRKDARAQPLVGRGGLALF